MVKTNSGRGTEDRELGYPNLLVTDFDGTLTQNDFFELAVARHLPPGTPDYWSRYAHGQITHFEAMQGIYRHIRASDAEMAQLLADMKLEPRLPEALGDLRAAGWDVVVVSAGSSWYIDQMLAQAGVAVTVYANPGSFTPEGGLLLELPVGSPFLSLKDGVDKKAVVADALGRYEKVAFAGNGPPDLEAALLVENGLRFARLWLAGELTKRRIAFRRFAHWREVAEGLRIVS